ncbi:helix-turn-helix domain-containing protein [Runella aurantiaca]|jgi:XRE family transcriptional regulator, regulator of sulfur utilization|uniref:Helix-turn-helix domain-containing protein n=1 Tax=Runella aurantiaca TaxID=2282308 RepID=A0A369IDK4_9BACT|nr:helix-turn-helix domain-containing protein [Runella aurantiaca]RDB07122.1 helix-turn-helix domain-containing protein [Runella aurantiaca]
MKTIAEKIRLYRLEHGLSQENMADSLGISTTAYGDIERGKTDLTLSRFYQIAEVLHISVAVLMGQATPLQQELQQLEVEKLQIENEKLRLENQYLREKIAGRMIIDLIQKDAPTTSERQRIGF